jgi:hypothetical protein
MLIESEFTRRSVQNVETFDESAINNQQSTLSVQTASSSRIGGVSVASLRNRNVYRRPSRLRGRVDGKTMPLSDAAQRRRIQRRWRSTREPSLIVEFDEDTVCWAMSGFRG